MSKKNKENSSKDSKSALVENLISANLNSVLKDFCVNSSVDEDQSAKKKTNNDEIDLNDINFDDYFGSQLKLSQDIQKSLAKEIVKPRSSKYKISSTYEFSCIPAVVNHKPLVKSESVAIQCQSFPQKKVNPLSSINNINYEKNSQNDMLKKVCHNLVDIIFSQKEDLDKLKHKINVMMITNQSKNVPLNISAQQIMYESSEKKRNYNYVNNIFEVKNENLFSITKKAKNREIYENNAANQRSISKMKYQIKQFYQGKQNEIIPEQTEESYPTTDKKENSDKYVNFQEIKIPLKKNNQNKESCQDIISLDKIEDDEFDNMLINLKKNKKCSLPSSKDPFKKSSNYQDVSSIHSKKKQSLDIKSNSKKKLIQSDFMAGGKQVSFNPNSKTIKLMKELEKDVEFVDDLGNSPQNSKKDKNNINDRELDNKVNKKRNYKELMMNEQGKLNETKKTRQKQYKHPAYKIEKQTTKEKFSIKNVILKNIDLIMKNFNIETVSNVEYYCICYLNNNNTPNSNCKICQGKGIISIVNFHLGFYHYIIEFAPNPSIDTNDNLFTLIASPIPARSNNKQSDIYNNIISFFKYQFKYLSFKYLLLSKIQKDSIISFQKSIASIYTSLIPKFKLIILEGKRSFITKVAEKDASINTNMILQIVNIKTSEDCSEFLIEFTDGYKSVFSPIDKTNPIGNLIKSNKIYIGMKLNIGLAKISCITDNFDVHINIFYNSISKASLTDKLGTVKSRKFMIKNFLNLRNDGGEISMINVILIKKYDYYINDIGNQMKYSKTKYEKIIENFRENPPIMDNNDENSNTNLSKRKSISEKTKTNLTNLSNFKVPENILFHFRILCADAMLYYNIEKKDKIEFNHSITSKLGNKKCYIDFTVKNFGIFEEFMTGNIYRLMLLNNTKKNYTTFTKEILNFKANDATLISEEKMDSEYKKDQQFKDLFSSIKENFKMKNDQDICNYLVKEQFQYEDLINQEILFCGLFFKKVEKKINISSKDDSKEKAPEKNEIFLFFTGLNAINIVLKIHSANFFDLDKFNENNHISKIKNGMNKLCIWTNVIFKSICFFDNSSQQLISLNSDKFDHQDKAQYTNLVVSLETSFYSDYKMITRGENTNFTIKDSQVENFFKIMQYI